jgi:hypothetical protein
MTDEDITARLRAVERALTDGDTAVEDLSETAAVHERLDSLAADVATLTERLDALDATVQSLHGYVGELEHVNARVARRADAARAAVERLDDQHLVGARSPENDSRAASGPDDQPDSSRDDPSGSAPGSSRADSGGTHSERSWSRADQSTSRDAPSDAQPDTHSLLDAVEDDRPAVEEESDDGSLLDRVRESL